MNRVDDLQLKSEASNHLKVIRFASMDDPVNVAVHF